MKLWIRDVTLAGGLLGFTIGFNAGGGRWFNTIFMSGVTLAWWVTMRALERILEMREL